MSRNHGRAVLRYGVAWLAATAVLVVGVLIAVRGLADGPDGSGRAVFAGPGTPCGERHDTGPADRSATLVMQPPTFGPPAEPAPAGEHQRSPRPEALVGALRRGRIVVQYRPGLQPVFVRRIEREFDAMERETVITPDATGMRYAIAVTTWRRVLGCSAVDAKALRAARDFALRYAGSGPDAGR